MPPIFTISNLPFSWMRVSSGFSKRLRIIFSITGQRYPKIPTAGLTTGRWHSSDYPNSSVLEIVAVAGVAARSLVFLLRLLRDQGLRREHEARDRRGVLDRR